jgi:hypothetical protein
LLSPYLGEQWFLYRGQLLPYSKSRRLSLRARYARAKSLPAIWSNTFSSIQLFNFKYRLCKPVFVKLAGADGFEPPYGWTKTSCLTAWRRPSCYKNLLCLYRLGGRITRAFLPNNSGSCIAETYCRSLDIPAPFPLDQRRYALLFRLFQTNRSNHRMAGPKPTGDSGPATSVQNAREAFLAASLRPNNSP